MRTQDSPRNRPAVSTGRDAERLVGLVPAAGAASRIQPLPCSKELLPLGLPAETAGAKPPVLRVAISHLLESQRAAGAEKALVVLRKGKWDIPNYLGDGSRFGLRLAFLVTEVLDGVPYTVDQAFALLDERALVLFGFPDIVFEPRNAFVRLVERHRARRADVTLGLFPGRDPPTMDMVAARPDGRVLSLEIKPRRTRLKYTWVIAVWGVRFGAFLNGYLKNEPALRSRKAQLGELQMGHAILDGLAAGLKVESLTFRRGHCLDIGTPGGLRQAFAGKPG
jgi:glucose-1-phosphate thymidylyltransferase